MASESSDITIPLTDVENIQRALHTAYYLSVSYDLIDNYRKLQNTNRASPISRLLKTALDNVEGYLEEDDD